MILSKIVKFKDKMHQNRVRLGLRPRPHWGAYSAPSDHLAGFKGLTSKKKVYRISEVDKGEGDILSLPRSTDPGYGPAHEHYN